MVDPERSVKISYDPEGDYLEVVVDRKPGYFRETQSSRRVRPRHSGCGPTATRLPTPVGVPPPRSNPNHGPASPRGSDARSSERCHRPKGGRPFPRLLSPR